MNALQRVLIMAGGTGGHVFPGLAVANYLRDQGVEVHWLGTAHGLEAKVVPAANFPLHFISIAGVRGKNIYKQLLAPMRLLIALLQALKILRRFKPTVVIGMGGFASGPGGIAAWLLRYPLVIHEQNARAGLTNRWLKKIAKKVFTGFPGVFPPQEKVVVIGNPVRDEIAALLPPQQRLTARQGGLNLLILGGSLGAQAINQLLPPTIARLIEEVNLPIHIYHQTGMHHDNEVRQAYQQLGVVATVVPFISDMQAVYARADLVICRAGALTLAELCAVGLGAILIPFPYAADDHQTANGQFLVKQGAALLFQQHELTQELLVKHLTVLANAPEKRLAMAVAAYQLRQENVAEKIYHICQRL